MDLNKFLKEQYGERQVSWDELWSSTAKLMSYRSRCSRDRVGAVLVTEGNKVISGGYNGAPAMYAGDSGSFCKEWCPRAQVPEGVPGDPGYRDCPSSHAEVNCLKRATQIESTVWTTMYVSRMPCYRCAVEIASARSTHNLTDVVVPMSIGTNTQEGDTSSATDILTKSGVKIRAV